MGGGRGDWGNWGAEVGGGVTDNIRNITGRVCKPMYYDDDYIIMMYRVR